MSLKNIELSVGDIAVVDKLETLTKTIRNQASRLGPQEVRYLVDNYYQMQDRRIAGANQERALNESGEPVAITDFFTALDGFVEKKARTLLQAWAESRPDAAWAMSIRGIGPVIASGLSAHIDITKAQTAGAIWKFAGYDPTTTWEKGQKRPWNAKLKVLCWKIGESFVKVQNRDDDVYGKIYAARKELEIQRNEAGEFADQAAAKLKTLKGKGTDAYKAYSKGKLPPGHIHARAKRYAVKLFLAHYHHVAYELYYTVPPPKPYVIDQLDHAHFIAPPNWK